MASNPLDSEVLPYLRVVPTLASICAKVLARNPQLCANTPLPESIAEKLFEAMRVNAGRTASPVGNDVVSMFKDGRRTSLSRLDLTNCAASDETRNDLLREHGRHLRHLNLGQHEQFISPNVPRIIFPQLLSLDFGDQANLSTDQANLFTECRPESPNDKPSTMFAHNITRNAPYLRTLSIDGSKWKRGTESEILREALATLPHLQQLSLVNFFGARLKIFEVRGRLDSLQRLDLFNSVRAENSLQTFQHLPALFANLRWLDISSSGHEIFSSPTRTLYNLCWNLPDLEVLDISGTNLMSLSTSDDSLPVNVGPERGLCGLHRRVKFLGIFNCPATEASDVYPADVVASNLTCEYLMNAFRHYKKQRVSQLDLVLAYLCDRLEDHVDQWLDSEGGRQFNLGVTFEDMREILRTVREINRYTPIIFACRVFTRWWFFADKPQLQLYDHRKQLILEEFMDTVVDRLEELLRQPDSDLEHIVRLVSVFNLHTNSLDDIRIGEFGRKSLRGFNVQMLRLLPEILSLEGIDVNDDFSFVADFSQAELAEPDSFLAILAFELRRSRASEASAIGEALEEVKKDWIPKVLSFIDDIQRLPDYRIQDAMLIVQNLWEVVAAFIEFDEDRMVLQFVENDGVTLFITTKAILHWENFGSQSLHRQLLKVDAEAINRFLTRSDPAHYRRMVRLFTRFLSLLPDNAAQLLQRVDTRCLVAMRLLVDDFSGQLRSMDERELAELLGEFSNDLMQRILSFINYVLKFPTNDVQHVASLVLALWSVISSLVPVNGHRSVQVCRQFLANGGLPAFEGTVWLWDGKHLSSSSAMLPGVQLIARIMRIGTGNNLDVHKCSTVMIRCLAQKKFTKFWEMNPTLRREAAMAIEEHVRTWTGRVYAPLELLVDCAKMIKMPSVQFWSMCSLCRMAEDLDVSRWEKRAKVGIIDAAKTLIEFDKAGYAVQPEALAMAINLLKLIPTSPDGDDIFNAGGARKKGRKVRSVVSRLL